MKTMHVTIIRCDGSEESREVSTMNQVLDLIGCNLTDIVNLRDGRVMLVDDNGWEVTTREAKGVIPGTGIECDVFETVPIRPRKPINEAATKLYHGVTIPGTTHAIVGDVAILTDSEWGEEA